VSQSRNIIIRIENLPKIGEAVVNENLKPIGKILDLFGPVSSPYASIKPRIQEIEKLADKMLYVLPSKSRKGKM
jgi:RNA-binding protein